MDMGVEQIREAGKKQKLSYIQSLSLYLFERVLYWISRSEQREEMWLRRPELPGKARNKSSNEIVFYRKHISYQELLQMAEQIFHGQTEDSPFQVKWDLVFYDRQLEMELDVRLEQVAVPFKIVVRQVWDEDRYPEKESYHPLILPEKEIPYVAYPIELELTECVYEIMDRMELVHDMQPFAMACCILQAYALDGRRMFQNFRDLFERQPLTALGKRWETIRGYQGYTYMKKRWNKYRKAISLETSWEECMQALDAFFSPIVEAIVEDRIFYGDWMPHLVRYLQ